MDPTSNKLIENFAIPSYSPRQLILSHRVLDITHSAFRNFRNSTYAAPLASTSSFHFSPRRSIHASIHDSPGPQLSLPVVNSIVNPASVAKGNIG